MTEPTEQEMLRAAAALGPFVRRWHLPLNPEDMDEIAYAVLRYARTDNDPDEIVVAVEQQIDQHESRARQLLEAMQAQIDRRRREQGRGSDDQSR
ncbi:hypothetical protein [Actinoplanes regularis]|uniref:Uncharacterized protein n=1 Tax=Actinoplanes regularis TaxID=52697 RepID=A0A238Z254_9ACTN|nr:hypothetical protein [Actinoplanes regularis]GIE85757.1 hypothetical protein Are01nite_22370 [Actinoplanes regularis]SNR77466.1 hypothetical protein SAMN06264365_105373 [Actinoplanes regularis]